MATVTQGGLNKLYVEMATVTQGGLNELYVEMATVSLLFVVYYCIRTWFLILWRTITLGRILFIASKQLFPPSSILISWYMVFLLLAKIQMKNKLCLCQCKGCVFARGENNIVNCTPNIKLTKIHQLLCQKYIHCTFASC